MTKQSPHEKLEKELQYERKSAWDACNPAERAKIQKFCEAYKHFLNVAKTERWAVKEIKKTLDKEGFKDISKVSKLKKGDKVYKIFKHRVIMAARLGKDFLNLRIVGSHIDNPRLDLKPNPLYEDNGLALLQSHYYGGIKKYQWVNVPLSMYAVVHTKAGKKEFCYGEKDDEPNFIIPDLLPHLARKQMEKEGRDIIKGEDLNIVVGNIPVKDEKVKNKIKLTVLKFLHDHYKIKEQDLLHADITFVPCQKPLDIGFDNSLIAAYGQDDRVCAFTSLRALVEAKPSKHTQINLWFDKEEIGSYGDTGAKSRLLEYFLLDLLKLTGSDTPVHEVFEVATALSADVTAGINPNFPDVHDVSNASVLGCGVSVEKYGGGGGKYSTNDASSEFMSWLVELLDKHKVHWQTGELGKIDIGGGGTIAMYLSQNGLSCIDVGPAVLAMHSNNELSSKVDVYQAYLCYKVFFEN